MAIAPTSAIPSGAMPSGAMPSGVMPSGAMAQPNSQSIQLHDIHTPEQISNFPVAPGWWILLALIIAFAIWLYNRYKQKKQLNAIKKQALTILLKNKHFTAHESISLIKWAAMHYFGRQYLAKQFGKHFQDFLTKQLPEKYQGTFIQLSTAGFESQYRDEMRAEEEYHEAITHTEAPGSLVYSQPETTGLNVDKDCYQAAKLWLTYALPVKTIDAQSAVHAHKLENQGILSSSDTEELSK